MKSKVGTIMVEHDGITERAVFQVAGQQFGIASAAQAKDLAELEGALAYLDKQEAK